MSHNTCDVVVVGGGPAGSTMASLLARRGHSVKVFERERFPREHVGESMLPFCFRLFEELGVRETMEQRFVRKPGVRFVDTDGTTNTAWCFAHHITDETALSFQVIRSEFDQVLLDNSASLGAEVAYESRVTDVDLTDEGAIVRVSGADGSSAEHPCRFVVDASGRDTFLSNRMRTKTAHKELERTALSCSYWKGARFVQTLEQGLIQIVYIGGEKQGWIWCIPLGNDRLSVGVVMNSSYYQAQRRVLKAAGVEDWKTALYLQEIQASPFTSAVLADAHMERDLMVNGDYSYVCHEKWGPNFALVGDASAFIDPIFSTGVFMAMKSAQIASEAVHIHLTEGAEEGVSALKAAYESIVGAYELIDKLIRLFYTPESINFAQLGTAGEAFGDFEHYRHAMGVYHFLIAGDFFEKSTRYSRFVDDLRDPSVFARYRKLVIDRPSLSATSCDVDHDVAFHPGLSLHEPRRERDRI